MPIKQKNKAKIKSRTPENANEPGIKIGNSPFSKFFIPEPLAYFVRLSG
jgi:hypothetical protein